jgi:hypothetical protein
VVHLAELCVPAVGSEQQASEQQAIPPCTLDLSRDRPTVYMLKKNNHNVQVLLCKVPRRPCYCPGWTAAAAFTATPAAWFTVSCLVGTQKLYACTCRIYALWQSHYSVGPYKGPRTYCLTRM